ncbi:MAG: NAD(P)-dependent oxidoreductase [Polyangia bacterium]
MLILVTGAASPLGTAVTAHFMSAGHSVRGLVRTLDHPAAISTEILRGDITDPAVVAAAARDVEVAVHCAASHASDLADSRRVNVTGTEFLCEALLASSRTPLLVHISTVSVYDDAAGPDFGEDSALWSHPSDGSYGFTKAEGERAIGDAVGRGLAAVTLRPSMILSLHARARWGAEAVARARASDGWVLPFRELPYTHEDNVVAAIVLATRTPGARGRAYNLVDAVLDTPEYLGAIYAAAGKRPPHIPPDLPRLRFAAERARRELQWRPAQKGRAFLSQLCAE